MAPVKKSRSLADIQADIEDAVIALEKLQDKFDALSVEIREFPEDMSDYADFLHLESPAAQHLARVIESLIARDGVYDIADLHRAAIDTDLI